MFVYNVIFIATSTLSSSGLVSDQGKLYQTRKFDLLYLAAKYIKVCTKVNKRRIQTPNHIQ